MLQQSNRLTLQDIFRPHNTGSPRQDVYNHLSALPQNARRDFEEHVVVGNLIVRIEPDLGATTDHEGEAKIVSVPYAERIFGNNADAVEFVRCVRLIVGDDARAHALQLIASHYYKEAKSRPANVVLKEMGVLALHLSAVTAMEEMRAFDGTVEHVVELPEHSSPDEELTTSERRAEFMQRAARILGEEVDEDNIAHIFQVESQCSAHSRSHASGFAYDEFAEHYAELEALTDTAEAADALLESYEAVYEQYDEDHVVSLHMTDGERVVVAGTLDGDVDEDSLPAESRCLAQELRDLYTSGFPLYDRGPAEGIEGVMLSTFVRDPKTRERTSVPTTVYGLDTWVDHRIEEIYPERVARTTRHLIPVPELKRPRHTVVVTRASILPRFEEAGVTKHSVTTHTKQLRYYIIREEISVAASRFHEQTGTFEVCPHAEEREDTRAVLEVLLSKLREDHHARAQHASTLYRELTERIRTSTDTAVLAKHKKQMWDDKEAGHLALKLFVALTTQASVRQSLLEGEPLREERSACVPGGDGSPTAEDSLDAPRCFIVAQPLINEANTLGGKTIEDFARRLSLLPRQEQERVRLALRRENPRLYDRVRDGLHAEVGGASTKKLGYFRWALYPGNKPEHPVHTLTSDDQATVWALLKSRSSVRPVVTSRIVH